MVSVPRYADTRLLSFRSVRVRACGMDAIGSDENGKADIDYEKCVSCGQCRQLPVRAISDKIPDLPGNPYDRSVGRARLCNTGTTGVCQPVRISNAWKTACSDEKLGFADVFELRSGGSLCGTGGRGFCERSSRRNCRLWRHHLLSRPGL